MLVELRIKDFAIIESLALTLGPGLNIFTGETGAGKSIIMDAIALILGDRASNDIIREGRDEAQVEALFDISGLGGVGSALEEAGLGECPSGELVIKRVVQRAGRNRIYVNGSLSTLVTLTELGRRLIDVYGQSEHQSLTRPEEHLEVLDSFAGLSALRARMSEAWKGYSAAKRELDELARGARDASSRKDFLGFQVKELKDAGLRPGEEERLRQEKDRLQASSRLRAVTEEAEGAIYSEAGSITERLGSIARSLKDLSAVDPRLSGVAAAINDSLVALEDAGAFLRDYSSSVEADPDGLEATEERIDLIQRLKKKHGATVDEMIVRLEALERELREAETLEFRLGEAEARLNSAMERAVKAAAALREARLAAAKELEGRIEAELSTLGMKGAVFEAAVDADAGADGRERLTEKGSDRVSFFIAANRGEGLKPLAKVASGGELSRIMLAMKSVIASGRVPTLIFDEIDTGVSGAMAQVVGLKLKEVAAANQVLSITHLPQAAAFADTHFAVEKSAQSGRTVTRVTVLEGEERVEHISAMLGGLKVTDTTRKHARELIEAACALSLKGARGKKKAEHGGKG